MKTTAEIFKLVKNVRASMDETAASIFGIVALANNLGFQVIGPSADSQENAWGFILGDKNFMELVDKHIPEEFWTSINRGEYGANTVHGIHEEHSAPQA